MSSPAPIPAPSARVVDQLSGEVAAGIAPVVREIDALRAEVVEARAESANIAALFAETERHNAALATELAHALSDRNYFRDEATDLRDSADEWWRRAQAAERELARLQEQQVRVDEQASRIQALEQALANAVSERDTARAGMAGRGQK